MSELRKDTFAKLGLTWAVEGAAIFGGWSALGMPVTLAVSAPTTTVAVLGTLSGMLALSTVPFLAVATVTVLFAGPRLMSEVNEGLDATSYTSLGVLALVPFDRLLSGDAAPMTGPKAFGPFLDLATGVYGLRESSHFFADVAGVTTGTGAAIPSWAEDINRELTARYPGWSSQGSPSNGSSGSNPYGSASSTGQSSGPAIGGGDLLPYSPGAGDFGLPDADPNDMTVTFTDNSITFHFSMDVYGSQSSPTAETDSNEPDQNTPPSDTPPAQEPSQPEPPTESSPPSSDPSGDDPGDDEPGSEDENDD